MSLQDFLKKAKDRNINSSQLDRYWRNINVGRILPENLNKEDRELVYEIIKKYRSNWLRGHYSSEKDLSRAYQNIYSRRRELNLSRKDLDDIKEVIYSFKK